MKILCVSDQIDPLIYTNSLKMRYADVDLVLCAGDLPMDYIDFIVSTLNKPTVFVFGNHHTKEYRYYRTGRNSEYDTGDENEIRSAGAAYIDEKVIKEEGVIISGLGGSMCYNKGENQFTNFQMKMRILKILPGLLFNRIFRGRYLDILLTHAPPLGIHDRKDKCHWGFECFLWFMKVFRPRYLVHGHIHLYDLSEVRITRYLDTTVVNAYGHYIIDTAESA